MDSHETNFVHDALARTIQPTQNGRPVSVDHTAARVGVPKSTLMCYCSSRHLPAYLIPAVVSATGDRYLLDVLLDACDCEPSKPRTASGDHEHLLLSAVKETSEALAAAADSEIDRKRLEREVSEAVHALQSLLPAANQ